MSYSMKASWYYAIAAMLFLAGCGSESPKTDPVDTLEDVLFRDYPELIQASELADFGAEGHEINVYREESGYESSFQYSKTGGMLERARLQNPDGNIYEFVYNMDGGAFLCHVITGDTLTIVLRDERPVVFVKRRAVYEVEDVEGWAEQLLSYRMDLLVNESEAVIR